MSRYQPAYSTPELDQALSRTTDFPQYSPGPSRSNILRQPGLPVVGIRHSQSVYGKHTAKLRTAHDVVPVEVEKDQAMFQNTVTRVDAVVTKMGDQNAKLSEDNTALKRHLQLTLDRLEEDDSEIKRCRKEIDENMATIDVQIQANKEVRQRLDDETKSIAKRSKS